MNRNIRPKMGALTTLEFDAIVDWKVNNSDRFYGHCRDQRLLTSIISRRDYPHEVTRWEAYANYILIRALRAVLTLKDLE